MAETQKTRRMTVPQFAARKGSGEKLSMLTAYDYPTAQLVDEAGVEGILVGDSLAMVVQGRENTLPVTLDQIIYHAEMVGRAAERALVVVDMPFLSYHLGTAKAIENAGRILKETRCQAVKLEGGVAQAETIAGLVGAGIPVMAHVGLGPQSVHQLGGYRVQRDEAALRNDARAAAEAGAFAVVLECVPSSIAKAITEAIAVPTIGIGAGPDCDGQVLVLHDVLGMASDYVPRFVKAYADLKTEITGAVRSFREEVRSGQFPAGEHEYE
jgi:3-methyl-2-oxobutanoate hydroxymethyltransferase